ncbi:class I SAM-dependent methyltransferase [Nocardia sp. NPDC004068]|uniref:16S rRNA (adenine(1408)-N(1))-methyltransferase WarA n=1 Tax=Nocardia sp. NPDC004068 TaxID=3364303 RepID=UPI00368AC737
MIGRYARVLVDLGTGDGRAVRAAAAADPERLAIGIDAHAAGMVETSRRILRGGVPNALFVVAAAERLPRELDAVADAVTIDFPWGSLLRGLLTADSVVLGELARIMKPDATLTIRVSVSDRDHGSGLSALDNPAQLTALVTPYASHGLTITDIHPLSGPEVVASGSTWGKRLGAGVRRPAWRIEARRTASTAARTG